MAEFAATTNVKLTVRGITKGLTVGEDGANVVVTANLASIEDHEGLALRTEGIRKALDVSTYPKAKLSVPRASLKFPGKEGCLDGLTAIGALEIHGKTKTKTFNYKVCKAGTQYKVDGGVEIRLSEHGIKPTPPAGATVGDPVTIRVSFSVTDN
jgi:polyisoprenoid-binding protein YceI